MKSIVPESISKQFICEVNMTERCNYTCSYCVQHPGGNDPVQVDFNKLFSIDYDDDTLFYICGGEPTLSKHFVHTIKEIYNRGFTNIVVQSNLTFNVSRILSELNNIPVMFNASYHIEHASFNKFVSVCRTLKDNLSLGDIHCMWTSQNHDEVIKKFELLQKIHNRVYLEPTIDFVDKGSNEIKKFLDLDLLKYNTRLTNTIFVDGRPMTLGEAMADQMHYKTKGCKCYVSKHTVVYYVNENRFYHCTVDSINKTPFNINNFNRGVVVCNNDICNQDLEYKKLNN